MASKSGGSDRIQGLGWVGDKEKAERSDRLEERMMMKGTDRGDVFG